MSLMRDIIAESLNLSQSQLAAAIQGEWEQFHDVEPKRQKLIRSLDKVDVDVVEPDEIRGNLEQLINLNDQIEKVCIEHRDSLMKTLIDLRAGAKATNAYGK
jgi:hypothetical protein